MSAPLLQKLKRALAQAIALQRGSSHSALSRSPDETALAQRLSTGTGPVLLLGVSGSGKSSLLQRCLPLMHGCTVSLLPQGHAAEAVGWEEAPFWGVLRQDGMDDKDWELPDVLRHRPKGLFELALPLGGTDRRLATALEQILIEVPRNGPHETRLSVLIDEAGALCARETLVPLLTQSRGLNIRLVLANQTLKDLPSLVTANFVELCLLRTSEADGTFIRSWVGENGLEPEKLPLGQAAWVVPTGGPVKLLPTGEQPAPSSR